MNGIFSKGLRYALSEPGTEGNNGARHKKAKRCQPSTNPANLPHNNPPQSPNPRHQSTIFYTPSTKLTNN